MGRNDTQILHYGGQWDTRGPGCWGPGSILITLRRKPFYTGCLISPPDLGKWAAGYLFWW